MQWRSGQRWAAFISGRGSNLAALLDEAESIGLALVVSSRSRAPGLLRARRAGVPTWHFGGDWNELHQRLLERGISRVFLLGFMKVLPADFVARWEGRIVNLHPSLLPSYPGLHSIERAYADDADLGVTVHVVSADVDAGPSIVRRRCLKQPRTQGYSLGRSELLIHIDEQRAVREVVSQWKP